MKKFKFIFWMLLIVGAVSCKYDDGALWDKVNSLEDRVNVVEAQLTKMNTDISAMGTLVSALENKVCVASIENTANGYSIKFSDGTVMEISNGKDGEKGEDAPVINFKEFEGRYYWTQIIGDKEDWLTDEAGNKIPVTGNDAVTPKLKVNTSGYWMISYDNGTSYTEMLDENGNQVKAVGKDGQDGEKGQDGQDGEKGQDGDTWFSDVKVVDGENGKVLTLTINGQVFELPMNTHPLETLDCIAPLTGDLGTWNQGYVTPQGYLLYDETVEAPTVTRASRAGETAYEYLSFLSLDETLSLNVLYSKEDKLPLQATTEEGTLYFSYPNDTILELVFNNGSEMLMQDSIPYSLDEINQSIAAKGYTDPIKKALFFFNYLVKGHSDLAFVKELTTLFEGTLSLDIDTEGKVVIDEFDLPKEEDGTFSFIVNITQKVEIIIQKIYYQLSIWTGKATFKVGGTSCTLSGTIWCPSPDFETLGEYGIVCDADPNKLTIEEAEYKGTGVQTDKSFEVDFRGLSAKKKYYYRAYYKFHSSDHGNIVFENGDPNAEICYDAVTKDFMTGDNKLNVKVVMCIDQTGSMSGIINTVKNNALGFYDIFNAACVEAGIELMSLQNQVVAFRDKNVDSEWLVTSPVYNIPEQKEEFSLFVNQLGANGGGDTPESGLEALDFAFSKDDWGQDDGYHRQIVILWTDAPYLIGDDYTAVELGTIKEKWDVMPSGRRLILFAPDGDGSYGNGGNWTNLDDWKNVMHNTDITESFESMDYIMDAIIGELTGKAHDEVIKMLPKTRSYIFRPNE